jgi:hypothetical protein
MDEKFILLRSKELEEIKELLKDLAQEALKKTPEKRFIKSSTVREMLGGISAAKLQSLRVGGHLPAINADGLWLYDVTDIMRFVERNKINGNV